MEQNSPLGNNVVDSLGDAVGVVIKTQVSQEHGTGEEHGSWVGLVLALDVQTDVTASWLENGNVTTHVATWDETWSTNEGSTNVGQDTSVQVWHDHDVELLWAGNTLHGSVVDNHVVGLKGWELLGDLVESVAEKTVGKLHDVGLVDTGDLLAVVGQSEAESELGDTLRLGTGDDLERLNNTWNRLVLKTGVFTLGVLTDDAKVDVLVAGLVTWDVLDEDDGSVDVELLAEGDVEGLVTGTLDWGVKDTLETELVALEGGDGLTEEFLGVLVAGLDTGNIDLLPLDWDVVGLEDGLDRLGDFSSDTITWDQGDSVLSAILGWLEDVGLDGSKASGRSLSGSQKALWKGQLAQLSGEPRSRRSHTCADRVEVRINMVKDEGIYVG
jgi:hypothetical protein